MKILQFLFACISLSSYSQMGVPFPTSNAAWINRIEAVDPNQSDYGWYNTDTYKLTNEDTLVSGQLYHKIFRCFPCNYSGAFREIDNKFYYIPKDSITEYLVYDFGVIEGQTLYNIYAQPYFQDMPGVIINELVVSNIDTVTYGGQERVQIQFNQNLDTWIEGIGNIGGFLHKDFINVSGYSTFLQCFSDADQRIYPFSSTGSCVTSIGINELNFNEILDVYPNPNHGKFKLRSEKINYGQIQVLDLTGREIYFNSDFSTEEEINLNAKSGTYLVILTSNNEVYKQKIILE